MEVNGLQRSTEPGHDTMKDKKEIKIHGKHKCRAKDCKNIVRNEEVYCSYECACYDGAFNVRDGWK